MKESITSNVAELFYLKINPFTSICKTVTFQITPSG